jgi:hypothetical protein
VEADQQCGYLRIETIIWKEEILPLIFYITLELNLSIGYKITKTNKKHRTSQFTNNQYQSNYQLKKSSCSDTLTQLDKLHAAATAQLDSIKPFTSWLQQNPVMIQQP